MPRIFPIIIVILLVFVGAIYWSTTFEHVEQNTSLDNNSSMKMGYDLTIDMAGYMSQMWPIIGILLFVFLLAAVLLITRGGD